ncbi:GNAT family N-acetyltransferase [Novosphingobium sp. PC22D]|uniref:GNAT family N-acetyltransferase n=1 Tax=Novosphingobium sp. PC22D TaxID=1962403 RepID=UPI000BF15124|nr:GNAT family N-acetyltransferase [Novosphingobium sp. PC22D]PEQ12068.1 GNAT family N-acetyltransferase [Novosphingobium sp. PC22D]
MTTGPVLQTERFELWLPHRDDLASLCRLVADDETRRFLGQTARDEKSQWERLMRNAGSWALYGYGTFYVRPRGSNELIANCGVFHSWRGFGADIGIDDVPEGGWIVRHDWWGRGVAGEVMSAALAWFDATIGATRIACMIEQGNTASERLAARLGFCFYRQHEADDTAEPVTLNLYERIRA